MLKPSSLAVTGIICVTPLRLPARRFQRGGGSGRKGRRPVGTPDVPGVNANLILSIFAGLRFTRPPLTVIPPMQIDPPPADCSAILSAVGAAGAVSCL